MKVPGLRDEALFRQSCYIDGGWQCAADGTSFSVDNPASGAVIGTVPQLAEAEIEQAVAAAGRALPGWRQQTADVRAEILGRWYELLLQQQEDLARIMTLEQGKPLAEARAEILYAASFLRWFGEEARRVYGETIPAARPGQHLLVLRQPVGVCALITPWNFPAAMITRKAGAALAAGCTVVAKPASATPYSALALAELGERAGLPPGVFNVVTGAADAIANVFTGSPVVRKISFTGSTAVGQQLMARSARQIQKISLELGGNAPFIVFDDADLDRAVDGLMAAKFRNSGQTCISVNRLLVQDGVHDEFVGRLQLAMQGLRVGDGFDPEVNQAALIDRAAVSKLQQHQADALAQGARLVFGGQPHPVGGNFVSPALLTGVQPQMRMCQEESFGPLLGITRFSDEEQAIALANDSPYGLASYFYSQDVHRVWRVAEALEAGMVGINEGVLSNAAAPFGGVKASGLGREGSRHGIEEYLEMKYLCMGAP